MIPQIYITDYLSTAAAEPVEMIQALVTQCPLLLEAEWKLGALPPLKALFAQCVEGDGSLAVSPLPAILKAAQAGPAQEAAFCLLPVHLGMRRDTFSLQAVVPLPAHVYAALTERLAAHFADVFVIHPDAAHRYWWITPLKPVDALCQWPQDCLYQQAFLWQPQGPDAALVRQWTNEIQMLLHQLAGASAMEDWPQTMNSLWFASVGEIPHWRQSLPTIAGQGHVFDGLKASQLPGIQPLSLSALLAHAHPQGVLWVADHWQTVDWQALSNALETGQLSKLTLLLPFAERSVAVHYKKQPRWQFWRKPPSLDTLLQQLETTLTATQ